MQRTIIAMALVLVAAAAGAQPAAGPTLGAVLQESVSRAAGGTTAPAQPGSAAAPTHAFKPLPAGAYRFENGEYSSGVSGISMRLPQVRDEKVVSVREAVVIARPNGDVATSHVVFVPGPDGTKVEKLGPVSAVVVTHFAGNRPRDRESVLKAWEPRTPEQRKEMEARGIEFHRIATGLGEGLERIVPNRIADENFPYSTHTETGVRNLQSVGVTRYLVSGEQALIEFSQVFPCRELAGEACKAAALKASDRFVQSVTSFVALRPSAAARPGASAASAPRPAASTRK